MTAKDKKAREITVEIQAARDTDEESSSASTAKQPIFSHAPAPACTQGTQHAAAGQAWHANKADSPVGNHLNSEPQIVLQIQQIE